MGQIKDLTGQRFGSLTVLEMTPERRNRQVVWKCQCDCGKITYVVGQALRTGHTKSCGCMVKTPNKAEDLTGQRFGTLTVLYRDFDTPSSNRKALWKCRCDCGNTRTVCSTDLRLGRVTECIECHKNILIETRGGIGPIKNHSGERFGKLLVIAPTKKRIAGKMVWLCKCDCGNMCEVTSNALVTKNTLSCGCLRNLSTGEQQIEEILKLNQIMFGKQITFNGVVSKQALRYDFAIFNEQQEIIRLIEFDGEQHFMPIEYFGGEEGLKQTQQRDNIKNLKAKEMNIPLVRIPYNKRNNVNLEDLFGDEYLVKF